MKSLRTEINVFFTALMYYTRLPVPHSVHATDDMLNRSSRYFPLIGILVGLVSAVTFYLASLAFHPLLALILSLCASVLMTGAFHEDGMADFCDGFGGGWTREKILKIMKDSRIGTFGFMGLLLVVLLKLSSLNEFAVLDIPFMLVCGHAISRFTAISFVHTHSYSQEIVPLKVKPMVTRLSLTDLGIAAFFGIIPLFFFLNPWIFLVFIPLSLCRYLLSRMFLKGIGGYTGDCLGATQQISEVVFYISAVAIIRFIPWN